MKLSPKRSSSASAAKHVRNDRNSTPISNSSTEAAKTSASRLLTRANHIFERVRELQAGQAARTQRKIDVSRERLARRLDMASTIAEEQRNVAGIVASEMGIAKVFGIDQGDSKATHSFKDAQSMQDIGERLLRSVGLASPSPEAISKAVEPNDTFISRLEAIRDEYAPQDVV